MREPLKVRISPNAIKTEWWISPSGGAINPAIKSRPPNTHRPTDTINWIFFIQVENLSPTPAARNPNYLNYAAVTIWMVGIVISK